MPGEGCSVTVADRDAAAGAGVARRIVSLGGTARFQSVDVSDAAAVERLITEAAAAYGRLDVLVNCAGVNFRGTLETTTPESWDRTMNVNLKSAFLAAKYALPHLLAAGRGSIINVASVQGIRGLENFTAYATTKAALQGLTRQLAVQYGPSNIRVNTLSPGGVATRLEANSARLEPGHYGGASDPNQEEADIPAPPEYDPTPRLFKQAVPADIANAILFLASDEAAAVTGHNLVVDGGRSIAAGAAKV